jgi:hypothetical protein
MSAKGLQAIAIGLALLAAGCAIGPLAGNPMPVHPALAAGDAENPLFVPQGPQGYALVFDQTYEAVGEFFDIRYSNRLGGEILTWPLITAGYAELPRLGPYDHYENLESTFQTIRRFAHVTIDPVDNGGYEIDVKVFKELEDLPRPSHSSAGASIFRTELPIERQQEVIDPALLSNGWIKLGRDHALEQAILARLRACL